MFFHKTTGVSCAHGAAVYLNIDPVEMLSKTLTTHSKKKGLTCFYHTAFITLQMSVSVDSVKYQFLRAIGTLRNGTERKNKLKSLHQIQLDHCL